MKVFILSLAIILSLFTCEASFAFTNTNIKEIYPVSSLKIHKSSEKTVYGIYSDNRYWAVIKKPVYTRLTKSYIGKTVKTVYPYHVKLFMRFRK